MKHTKKHTTRHRITFTPTEVLRAVMKAYPQTFLDLAEKDLTITSDDNGTEITSDEDDKEQRTRFLDGQLVRVTFNDPRADDRMGVVVADRGGKGVSVTFDGHNSFSYYCHSRVSLL